MTADNRPVAMLLSELSNRIDALLDDPNIAHPHKLQALYDAQKHLENLRRSLLRYDTGLIFPRRSDTEKGED